MPRISRERESCQRNSMTFDMKKMSVDLEH